jgi:hypothetical protein
MLLAGIVRVCGERVVAYSIVTVGTSPPDLDQYLGSRCELCSSKHIAPRYMLGRRKRETRAATHY